MFAAATRACALARAHAGALTCACPARACVQPYRARARASACVPLRVAAVVSAAIARVLEQQRTGAEWRPLQSHGTVGELQGPESDRLGCVQPFGVATAIREAEAPLAGRGLDA